MADNKKLKAKLIHFDIEVLDRLDPYLKQDCVKLAQHIRKLLKKDLEEKEKCLNQN